MTKIYIDPGHGGSDPGAVGNGLEEKDIVLAISKEMERQLGAYENVEVKLSRDSDITKSLGDRTKEANLWRANVYVSIHTNAFTKNTAKGFQTYIYPTAPTSTVSFQNVMHSEIVKQIKSFGIEDDGKQQANFHVLRESAMTAILSENMFISNPGDASLLKQEKFIKALATGHVLGLERFYGLKKKAATPTPPKTKTLYQVVTGTFSEKANAEQRASDLKKDGYDSYIQEKQ